MLAFGYSFQEYMDVRGLHTTVVVTARHADCDDA